jgi:ribosomal protein S18 acetylase RimI-like enzyme
MVLVDVNARGRGIGTLLLRHALDYLEDRRVLTVRLDATPAGRPVYEKLGFLAEYELVRYEGMASRYPVSQIVTELVPEAYRDIVEFDKKETGTDRGEMLVRLFGEFPQGLRIVRRQGTVEGYVIIRPGANAIQVGPCVAATDAGAPLLSDAFTRCRGKMVFVDVPMGNADAVRFVEAAGLRVQRCFTRMYRGKRVDDNITALWASSGPEKG